MTVLADSPLDGGSSTELQTAATHKDWNDATVSLLRFQVARLWRLLL